LEDRCFLRPIVKEVVKRYLGCGNPKCGFARLRCPDCGEERILMFSCRKRGFCQSCHAKGLEEWNLHFLVTEGGAGAWYFFFSSGKKRPEDFLTSPPGRR